MVEIGIIHKKLRENIGKERYLHSIRVMDTAKELASFYNCDINKAELAGLLHDCGKIQDKGLLLKMIKDFGIILDNIMEKNINLVHGPLGAEIVKRVYNIHDTDIINAIKFHTTGRPNMSLLEKIIYIADYIEPEREFDGLEKIRKLAFNNLDKAILHAMNNTIKYVIDKGVLLHIDTVKARNYFLSVVK
ncbi:phosphohydrolase [Thermohalobacter berrensis]|uniref:bis(5'-nucleosyl)-tetraphosphatase (symmetrical) n=2 Tax=Thermohalobacter berrensis TaxID=99594 RepID=A0A419T4X5_9FIRM|nr:phosphohydrolase [Thermohalobacter berrensis]